MDAARNGYAFLLTNYPYSKPAAAGYVVFVPFVKNTPGKTQAKALPFPVVGGQSYRVAITVAGDTFAVAAAGPPVATVTDFTSPAGTVGFRESGAESGRFDNVVVTAPDGTVLL